MLRPGGRLLVIQPNFRYAFREYFDDYTHRSMFTDVSLPNLLRAQGFEIERVRAALSAVFDARHALADRAVAGSGLSATRRSSRSGRAQMLVIAARRRSRALSAAGRID